MVAIQNIGFPGGQEDGWGFDQEGKREATALLVMFYNFIWFVAIWSICICRSPLSSKAYTQNLFTVAYVRTSMLLGKKKDIIGIIKHFPKGTDCTWQPEPVWSPERPTLLADRCSANIHVAFMAFLSGLLFSLFSVSWEAFPILIWSPGKASITLEPERRAFKSCSPHTHQLWESGPVLCALVSLSGNEMLKCKVHDTLTFW